MRLAQIHRIAREGGAAKPRGLLELEIDARICLANLAANDDLPRLAEARTIARDLRLGLNDAKISTTLKKTLEYHARNPGITRPLPAETAAKITGLTEEARLACKAFTLGAVDASRDQLKDAAAERSKARKAAKRRAEGKLTRAEYLLQVAAGKADSEAKNQPWIALGVSRRTYYSRKKAEAAVQPAQTTDFI